MRQYYDNLRSAAGVLNTFSEWGSCGVLLREQAFCVLDHISEDVLIDYIKSRLEPASSIEAAQLREACNIIGANLQASVSRKAEQVA